MRPNQSQTCESKGASRREKKERGNLETWDNGAKVQDGQDRITKPSIWTTLRGDEVSSEDATWRKDRIVPVIKTHGTDMHENQKAAWNDELNAANKNIQKRKKYKIQQEGDY